MAYHFNFDAVWRNFDRLLWGWVLSIEIAAFAIVAGAALGLCFALIHNNGGKAGRVGVRAYVELFRNVPLLLLVYAGFYGLPSIGGLTLGATETFALVLTVYASAQFAEVFRAGLDAVPRGVVEAGRAIGLHPLVNLRLVVAPLMFRACLPSLGNLFISFFKETSLASAIAVPELTYGAQWINLNSFRVLEVYAIVTPMYLVTSYTISLLVQATERRFRRAG